MAVEPFATRCGVHDDARAAACEQFIAQIRSNNIRFVRFSWCDAHGMLRSKTLSADAAVSALLNGVAMVGTLVLKDTSDRTAYRVFDADAPEQVPGFAFAGNLLLLADPGSLTLLPWAPGVASVHGELWFEDGRPLHLDTRRVLRRAISLLAERGWVMRCGLEVEFHIYRISTDAPSLDPMQAAWPGQPPDVTMIHPGYCLLSDAWMDLSDEPLQIVADTARELGLSLTSLEIELGPSQVEAVFDVTDALLAADNMVRFRNGVRQALRRAGYYATFMCRPPFPGVMASGWHLHHSVSDVANGSNLFTPLEPIRAETSGPGASSTGLLSDIGNAWLAGLLDHAEAITVFGAPTSNAYGRFQPNALAPQSIVWGQDNRGAMLRVIGGPGNPAARIENRVGEPSANPYLYLAAQAFAGLDGVARRLVPPAQTSAPYDPEAKRLPRNLGAALAALNNSPAMTQAFGQPFADYYTRIKHAEWQRCTDADDPVEFDRREYFSRI